MNATRRTALALIAALISPWGLPGRARAAEPPVVAAAADLASALPEVAAAFQRRTGRSVKLVFGSSGAFTQQILAGAPFEVFLSADEGYVATLDRAGRTDGPGALYAEGRIGLFIPPGSPLKNDMSLKDLGRAAQDGRLARLAIANPAHAPYGRAARQALEHAGVWAAVEPKLVLGENVAQTTQFAASGAAQGGIIPLSLAAAPEVKGRGKFVLIPDGYYAPLRQRAALLKGAGSTARQFFGFLQGAEAREILATYGFTRPG